MELTAVRAAVVALLVALTPAVAVAQHLRVDPGASEILGHRLTDDSVTKVRQVMHTLDAYRAPSPEAPRPDVAMITVVGMSFVFKEPLRDAALDDHVGALNGHPALVDAVRAAGMTPREYVLTWMTLLLSYPVVAGRQPGARPVTSDVAPDNVAFVQARAAQVTDLMRELSVRAQRARSGG